MNDQTKVTLLRLTCGTAILITSIVTGVNGKFISIGLFLLGVPIEYAKTTKEKDTSHSEG